MDPGVRVHHCLIFLQYCLSFLQCFNSAMLSILQCFQFCNFNTAIRPALLRVAVQHPLERSAHHLSITSFDLISKRAVKSPSTHSCSIVYRDTDCTCSFVPFALSLLSSLCTLFSFGGININSAPTKALWILFLLQSPLVWSFSLPLPIETPRPADTVPVIIHHPKQHYLSNAIYYAKRMIYIMQMNRLL
jgi:hypothetical protein